jgi:hypothetical protein
VCTDRNGHPTRASADRSARSTRDRAGARRRCHLVSFSPPPAGLRREGQDGRRSTRSAAASSRLPPVLLGPASAPTPPAGGWSAIPTQHVYDGKNRIRSRACRAAPIVPPSVRIESLTRHLREAFPGHFAACIPAGKTPASGSTTTLGTSAQRYDPATRAASAPGSRRAAPGRCDAERLRTPRGGRTPRPAARPPAGARLIDFACSTGRDGRPCACLAAPAAAARRTGVTLFFYATVSIRAAGNGAPTSGHYALENCCGAALRTRLLCSPTPNRRQWLVPRRR